ncbi:heterokaryon incompatibility protein-domain-containing protein [Flammula alnicola]|nr:heterokaryon incompatibility protein-domain-containing protein [Flammula alnicola]
MDALRERVFNHMPIRVLAIGPGSEIKLLEKSAVLQHIIRKVEDVYQRPFDQVIQSKAEHRVEKRRRGLIPETWDQAIIEDFLKKYASYAVLSHTWLQDEPEVTYQAWPTIHPRGGAGYTKLARFCDVAAKEHHVSFVWMDTVCINKDSSSELDESIRSMYRWYREASICLVYLADTTSLDDMPHDRWFTRGWTLQELLAPRKIKFYTKNWISLSSNENDKESNKIHQIIKAATGITPRELSEFRPGISDGATGGLARRMVWAANRKTTREEDQAYSLMGIFGVSFSIAYGEGAERAFFRLIEVILASFRDVSDVLNWAGSPISSNIHSSRLIPSSPRCYLESVAFDNSSTRFVKGHDKKYSDPPPFLPSEPMSLTHRGLRVTLLLFSAYMTLGETSTQISPRGNFLGEIILPTHGPFEQHFYLLRQGNYLDHVLGVWNFFEQEGYIHIPTVCLAVLFPLRSRKDPSFCYSMETLEPSDIASRQYEEHAVLFTLKHRDSTVRPPYSVKTKDLAKHGMKLLTLYV